MNIAVIQARTSSSRLPGKVMKPILEKPMLQYQIERIQRAHSLDRIILATSVLPEDDPIVALGQNMGIDCFRGSLEDVLERFFQAASTCQPSDEDTIIRLTGDCPLVDPDLIDALIRTHREQDVDYTSNALETSFPHGLDLEAFRFRCLKEAWEEATLPSHREHVTLFIYRHPERYRLFKYKNDVDLSHLRWTVDEPEDFQLISRIYEALYPVNPMFTTADVLALLEQHPHLVELNAGFARKVPDL